MTDALTYDVMLEAGGLIRSQVVHTKLDRDLQVGEVITMRDRRWLVSRVQVVANGRLDRRLIAREVTGSVGSGFEA